MRKVSRNTSSEQIPNLKPQIWTLNQVSRIHLNKPVVSWGIFDGVHLGHQRLIRNLVLWAREIKGTSVVLTFEKHPEKILKKSPPLFITSIPHRILLLKRLGVEMVLVHPFTYKFSRLTAHEFIQQIIKSQIKAYGIMVSRQTRFGRHGTGDINLLKKLCPLYHLRLRTVKERLYQGKIISSSLIREAVRRGRLAEAKSMLGRNITLLGTVIPGRGRGRRLGIPTANLDLHHELIPPRGVYAAQARVRDQTYHALVNIGVRPTFYPRTRNIVVEVHLLNFSLSGYQGLYGKELEVEIIRRLRPEKKFPDAASLIHQIEQDKKYFPE